MKGFRNMIKYTLDKKHNIGTVIFVVEGGRPETGGTELRLLKMIFADILDYRVDELRRGEDEFIAYGSNPYSRVFALNLPKNQLTQLTDDAMDELFRRLRNEFKIKPEDCPLFFVYDRDYLSYHTNELRGRYVKRYVNPYSDDEGNQGQLLLSYPCVESYILSLHMEDVYKIKYGLGKTLKKDEELRNNMDFSGGISENELINAVYEMDKGLNYFSINEYDIDDLAPTFLEVYEKEQKAYKKYETCNLFSFFSMALLELGIISKTDDE